MRFDAGTRATTGTPVDTAIDYAAVFWGRDSATHLDTDFAFDYLVAKRGKYYLLSYYTRLVWQDTTLTLSENSTHDSHALLVQNDELEVIVAKASELASGYLRDEQDRTYFRQEYELLKERYRMSHPSQSNVMTSTRYILSSLEDEPTSQNDS
ncbi:MAG TPA: hypothetical protein ENI13_00575 [candidate division CPR3 bacterium]|uniref:Uncharacterized protein n=1 Tax=candidate division CPR3 bacterium TaxID=2268181 RepID=A0A7C1SUK0_UNCC3|nr:hypothetical protein [candidate division CPR3 bacterium]